MTEYNLTELIGLCGESFGCLRGPYTEGYEKGTWIAEASHGKVRATFGDTREEAVYKLLFNILYRDAKLAKENDTNDSQ